MQIDVAVMWNILLRTWKISFIGWMYGVLQGNQWYSYQLIVCLKNLNFFYLY